MLATNARPIHAAAANQTLCITVLLLHVVVFQRVSGERLENFRHRKREGEPYP
jgi:hypothetical protein